jgi:cytochrome c oxidase subunit II
MIRVRALSRRSCRAAGVRNAHFGRGALACVSAVVLSACEGPQSALAPAGVGAENIAQLFWAMLIGAGLIWLVVVGFAIYVTRVSPRAHSEKTASRLILWGGFVFPVVVLAALLSYGLVLMPSLRVAGDDLRIAVSGEQWWWRVRYLPPGAKRPIVSANEIRLPVGERVEITLTSPDVIHSFWVPPLAGKVDMIPGRRNRLVIEATRTGVYRGVCAEYCGTSHALMAFSAVVMEKADFDAWLAQQARPAAAGMPRGRKLFLATGCGACHTIRGTPARGQIGPDLTHVGGRKTVGAGILPNNATSIARWIAHTQRLKPGVRMPSFGMLPEREIAAIAAYLASLK